MSKTTSQRLVAWLYNGKHCVVLDIAKIHDFRNPENSMNFHGYKIPLI